MQCTIINIFLNVRQPLNLLPPAYSVYAHENDDNFGRPLKTQHFWKLGYSAYLALAETWAMKTEENLLCKTDMRMLRWVKAKRTQHTTGSVTGRYKESVLSIDEYL